MSSEIRELGVTSFGTALVLGAGAAVLAIAGLSLLHPWGDLRSNSNVPIVLGGATTPDELRRVLADKCNDCHSNNTHWPAYSKIAPMSWLIEQDVHEGRQHLNFSLWDQYSTDVRIDLLAKMSTEVRQGKMPLKQYLLLHPRARLSDAERTLIRDWTKAERKRLISQNEK